MSKYQSQAFTEEQLAIYEKIRHAKMRNEIEIRVSEYKPDEDVMHGVKAAHLQNDEFLDFAGDQLERYADNIEGDEIWHVIDDSIRICGLDKDEEKGTIHSSNSILPSYRVLH